MRGTDWTPEKLSEFSDHIAEVHDAGYLPFTVHLCGGNEQQLIDIFADIKEGDYVLSTHRNSYHALLHGIPPEEVEQKMRMDVVCLCLIVNVTSMFLQLLEALLVLLLVLVGH